MDELKKILGDEKYAQLTEILGDTKVIVDNGEYVPKQDYIPRAVFNEKLKEKDTAHAEALAERDKQLAELSKKAQGNEDMTAEIEKLKSLNEQTAQETAAKLEAQEIDHMVELALRDAMCIDSELFSSKIDRSKIKGVADPDMRKKIVSEQVTALKENEKFKPFFGEIKTSSPEHRSGDTPSPDSYFTREEVSTMTPKQVEANYDKVVKSMEKWSESDGS